LSRGLTDALLARFASVTVPPIPVLKLATSVALPGSPGTHGGAAAQLAVSPAAPQLPVVVFHVLLQTPSSSINEIEKKANAQRQEILDIVVFQNEFSFLYKMSINLFRKKLYIQILK
jgi:hypothetical protein